MTTPVTDTSYSQQRTGSGSGSLTDMPPQRSPGTVTDDTLDRVVGGAHEAVDRVAAKAAPMVEQIKSGMAHATDEMHHLGELGDEWTESLRSSVRAHPLTALALAVAVGVIVSRMSAR